MKPKRPELNAMPICPKCETSNPQLAAQCPRDEAYFIHDEALAQAKGDARIGTIAVNKYVIVGRISKGGMGAVYRAIQLPVEREIAFKVLRTEMENSDQGRERFILEARAVSRLAHPNIITLHDFGFEPSGHPYMVMEYAPGKEMGTWLREEALTMERILRVIRQLLSALDEAHRQGIVHRDLKPENLIVTTTSSAPDVVKLLDFGIARMINETNMRGLTREGEVFGTPHYMSPEQAQGAREVGPPADVYAVGIMLYELITGHPPFDAPTPLAVLMMHIGEPLPPLTPRQGVAMPESFIEIIERSTHKSHGERYQDAGEMLRALDTWIAQQGIYTSTGSFPSPFHPPTTSARAQPQETTPPQAMHPTMTDVHQPGVPIQDPRPTQRPAHELDDELEAPKRSRLVALVLGVLATALLLTAGLAYAMMRDGAQAQIDQTVVTQGGPRAASIEPAPRDTTPSEPPSRPPARALAIQKEEAPQEEAPQAPTVEETAPEGAPEANPTPREPKRQPKRQPRTPRRDPKPEPSKASSPKKAATAGEKWGLPDKPAKKPPESKKPAAPEKW